MVESAHQLKEKHLKILLKKLTAFKTEQWKLNNLHMMENIQRNSLGMNRVGKQHGPEDGVKHKVKQNRGAQQRNLR